MGEMAGEPTWHAPRELLHPPLHAAARHLCALSAVSEESGVMDRWIDRYIDRWIDTGVFTCIDTSIYLSMYAYEYMCSLSFRALHGSSTWGEMPSLLPGSEIDAVLTAGGGTLPRELRSKMRILLMWL